MNTAFDSTQCRQHFCETQERQRVSLFAGQDVFFGDFIDTSPNGIRAEFTDEPTVKMGELVRVLVRFRLHDAIVRQIRRTDSATTLIGLEILETPA